MRKIYALILLMLLPLLAAAQDNKAVSITCSSSYYSSKSQARILVPLESVGLTSGVAMAGTEDYSIGMWFKVTNVRTQASTKWANLVRIGAHEAECSIWGGWFVTTDASGDVRFHLGADNVGTHVNNLNNPGAFTGDETTFLAGANTIGSIGTVDDSATWHYLLLSFDNSNHKLRTYIDGEKKSEWDQDGLGYKWTDGAFEFGGFDFNGAIDEIHMFKSALTDVEATAAYANAYAVSSLGALYTFDDETSDGSFNAVAGSQSAVATHSNPTFNSFFPYGLYYGGGTAASAPTFVDGREIVAAEATVTLTQTTGGTLTVKNGDATLSDGANTVSGGSTLTFEATPEAGYALQGIDVTVGDVTVRYAADASYVVVADATITPVWSNTLYALTVVKDDDVTIAVTRSGAEVTDLTSLFGGEDYKVAVTVPNEKKLVSVKLGETVLTADADGLYTVNLSEAATLTIETVAKAQYTVTINQVDGGTITVTDADGNTITSGSTVLEGTVLTVATTADPGYKIETVTANGTQIGTTVTVNGNVEISATFVEGLDYPEMVRFYTNGINQQNRYVKEVTTTGTQTPTVFSATTTAELPYTAVSTYGETNATSNGAVIDKTANPIVITDDVTSFTMTFTAWSDAISSYASELGWSNQAAYIDWNRDGKFNGTNENYASDGEAHSNSHFVTSAYTRTVTIPAGVAPGTYRMRVVYHEVTNPGTEAARTEWVSTFWDGDAPYKLRNGVAYDFDIRIVSSELENPRTVTVASADEEMGTVAITSPATDENSITTNLKSVTMTATAAEGATFMNWTDAAGSVVSTDATYTYTGTEDASFTANFGYTVTFEAAPTDGTIVVKYNGSAITSGTVVPAGAELTIEATPVSDRMLVGLTANGVSIFEDMSCIVDAATTIVATFGDRIITANVTVVGNGRVVMATEWNTDGTGPDESTVIESGSSISGGVTFFIYPNDDDQLVSVTLEGSNTTEESPYTESADMVDVGYMLYSVAGDAEYPYYVYAEPRDGASEIVLTAVFSGTSTAIDGIEADDENAPVEYFNLQGIRVNSDNLTPGVYVRRQGSKTTKVLVTGK